MMYPVVIESLIRVHGAAARRAFNEFKLPVYFGEKGDTFNVRVYKPCRKIPTFDHAHISFRVHHSEKRNIQLWFFMSRDDVEKFQGMVPGLIKK